MKFGEVPDEFISTFMEIEREVKPEYVIKALKWASSNPEAARSLAERHRRLGHLAKKEFEVLIWCGWNPEDALNRAEERQAEVSEKRSALARALAKAKSGGFYFKMPNGVECVMRYRDDEYTYKYEFTFQVCGSTIIVKKSKYNISEFLTNLMKGSLLLSLSDKIIYNGEVCEKGTVLGNVLIKAIMENVKPEVLAAIEC